MRDESTCGEMKEIERNRPFLYNTISLKPFQYIFVFIIEE
jgi:hypothetical protein